MLLLGIFYSSHKPTMNMFLRPVIDDINQLYTEGKHVCVYALQVCTGSSLVILSLIYRFACTNT